jgi:hypothetical protein
MSNYINDGSEVDCDISYNSFQLFIAIHIHIHIHRPYGQW